LELYASQLKHSEAIKTDMLQLVEETKKAIGGSDKMPLFLKISLKNSPLYIDPKKT